MSIVIGMAIWTTLFIIFIRHDINVNKGQDNTLLYVLLAATVLIPISLPYVSGRVSNEVPTSGETRQVMALMKYQSDIYDHCLEQTKQNAPVVNNPEDSPTSMEFGIMCTMFVKDITERSLSHLETGSMLRFRMSYKPPESDALEKPSGE